ncbi:33373_t:CDS:1, partial [Racocetra persica]
DSVANNSYSMDNHQNISELYVVLLTGLAFATLNLFALFM